MRKAQSLVKDSEAGDPESHQSASHLWKITSNPWTYLWFSIIGTRARTNSQNNSNISYAAHVFCSRMICSTYLKLQINQCILQTGKSQHREKRSRNQQLLTKTRRITLILAIASWPACKNWLISLHICFSWISLLFCSSLIREIARFRHVLLQDEKHHVYQCYLFGIKRRENPENNQQKQNIHFDNHNPSTKDP